jgi:hypothetical protein
MATEAERSLQRWLAHEALPPRRTRLLLELAALIVLAAAHVSTGSEVIQAIVFFWLLFVAVPVAERVFRPAEPDEYWEAVRRLGNSTVVFAPAILAMLVLIAVGSVVADMAPGSWFWAFAFPILSFELQDLLGRRRYRAEGVTGWDRTPPLSHSGLAGAVTVPLVLVLAMLFDQDSLLDAAVWALACGLGVFLLGAVLTVVVPANRPTCEGRA